jgi:hypothetical protein
MSFLSSPRQRRRLLWLTPVLGAVGLIALVIWLLPSRGGSSEVQAPPELNTQPASPAPPAVDRSQIAADVASRRAADKVVRPLAEAFVADVAGRRNLVQAHALLGSGLRSKYSLDDWQAGHGLPFSTTDGDSAAPSTILSFYAPGKAGFVSAVGIDDEATGERSTLVAIRFVKSDRWLIDYLRTGHSSQYISQANFAPPGFLPGSHEETFWTWTILVLGFLGVVAIVAFLDRWLARGGRRAAGEPV